MRNKNEVLKDLGEFYSKYQNTQLSNLIDDVRKEYKSLREEVKEHCPDDSFFKPKITIRTVEQYKIPEMASDSLELLRILSKKK